MNFTSAKEVISYLYSLPSLHPKSDLSYIRRVLQELGNPQNKVKTIHVTGTNGKGSTCYYLSNLLKKAGQKTGLFVSPYVREFNERIQLNGQNISDSSLVKVANQVKQAVVQLQKADPAFALVTFEYETAMAFLYFEEEHCDYAVIEVGIGGQHDKTNVIVPQLSIIATVGLDHERIIGPTLADIAREKSGVIKHDRPVLLGSIPSSVLPIIRQKAEKEGAPVYLLGRNFAVREGKRISYQFADHHLVFNLRPKVESFDIALAVTAFYLLKLKLPAEEIEQAIDQTQIPGRYQVLQRKPLIVLDGAHNLQAMSNLLHFVRQKQEREKGRLFVLITMMKDKDLTQVFALFRPTDLVTLTSLAYPRAAKLNDFPLRVQQLYPYIEDSGQAFISLKSRLRANDILLVTGSFYLVSAILQKETKNES